MRAFIAIELPEDVLREIVKIQKSLPEFSGKLTERENIHLTLKFLGEIDEDKVEEVKTRLREIKFEKFSCEIDEIGVFNSDFIKIVWVHLKSEELLKLQKEIDDKLKSLSEPERRFMSHVTIARVKNCDKKKFLAGLDKIKINKMKFEVDNFKLRKSNLTPSGPIYSVIEEFNLS